MLRGQLGACAAPAPARRAAASAASQRLGGRGGVADHAQRHRPVGADRLLVEVDLRRRPRRGASSFPWPVVHWFRAAPKATTTSASPSSCAASGLAKPPAMPRSYGIAGEEAVGHGAGGQQRARELAQRPQRRPAPASTAPRPATIPGRRAPASRSASAVTRGLGRARPRERKAVAGCRAVGTRRRLHVEGQHEHHGTALDACAAYGAGDVGHRPVAGLCTRSAVAPTASTRPT
jgi:hypothetical protein